MRWTIQVCGVCGRQLTTDAQLHLHDVHPETTTQIDREGLSRWIEVVPASFTDEDVERVADVLSRDRMAEGDDPPEPFGYWTGELDRRLARAALTAFLEPTTKGDT